MIVRDYDESVLLNTGEADIDAAFKKVEKMLPLPKAIKHMLLDLMTYVLCM